MNLTRKLKKNEKELVRMYEEEGCVLLDVLHGKHNKVVLRLPDGREVTVPLSNSPRDAHHAILSARRQIRHMIQGRRWGEPE